MKASKKGRTCSIEFTYITKYGFYRPLVVTWFDVPGYRGNGMHAYMCVPGVNLAVSRLMAFRFPRKDVR